MDQHRWQRIERLYHSALGRDPEQRNSYLAQECREDEDLRREVESLLEQQDSPEEQLLDRPISSWLPAYQVVANLRTPEVRRWWRRREYPS